VFQNVETGSRTHPASYPWAAGLFFPQLKWSECEADHSHPLSAEVMRKGSNISAPPYAFTESTRTYLHHTCIFMKMG